MITREELDRRRVWFSHELEDSTEESLAVPIKTIALTLGMILHELTYMNDSRDVESEVKVGGTD